MTDIEVKVIGLEKLLKALDGNALLAQPVKDALEKSGFAVLNEAHMPGVVPIDTGRLRASLSKGGADNIFEMDAKPVPLWAKVGTKVVYAKPLAMPKTRNPHYRYGPSKGKETGGWADRALANALPKVEAILNAAAKKIAERWG